MTGSLIVNRFRKAERFAEFIRSRNDRIVESELADVVTCMTEDDWSRVAFIIGESLPSTETCQLVALLLDHDIRSAVPA